MKVDGLWLRRFAYWGARYGPRPFLEHAPGLLGGGFFSVLPAVRRRVLENLRLVLGERESHLERRDARRTFANFANCLAETMALEREEAKTARLTIEARPGPHGVGSVAELQSWFGARRGLVVVTAHVGPFEAAAKCLARELSKDVLLVMAPEPDARARRYHDLLRERHGVRVAHVGDHPTDGLRVLSHLKAGGVAALQLDRVVEHGRVVDQRLFGSPQRVPVGPFRLAGLAQVPLVSVFASRRGFFDYELAVGAPLHVERRPSAPDLERAAGQVLGELELAISRDPTQWFHFER
jgi:lauroyl/myristoyl acyltransferase